MLGSGAPGLAWLRAPRALALARLELRGPCSDAPLPHLGGESWAWMSLGCPVSKPGGGWLSGLVRLTVCTNLGFPEPRPPQL